MGLGQLLEDIRQHYVDHFLAVVRRLQRRAGAKVRTEVALCDSEGQPVCEGTLHLPLRIDAVVVQDGEAIESISVDAAKMLSFEPVLFQWSGNLTVFLGPFAWHALEMRLPRLGRGKGWAALQSWFKKWFREDEDGEGALLGLVHFLSDPEESAEAVSFTVDLGSAPVEAFEELLDAIAACGVSETWLGEAGAADSAAPAKWLPE
jgi:hypothetical protein